MRRAEIEAQDRYLVERQRQFRRAADLLAPAACATLYRKGEGRVGSALDVLQPLEV